MNRLYSTLRNAVAEWLFFLATWLAPSVFVVLLVNLMIAPNAFYGLSFHELLSAVVSLFYPCGVALTMIKLIMCIDASLLTQHLKRG